MATCIPWVDGLSTNPRVRGVTRLRDAERLLLYAQSAFPDQKAFNASLKEAESNSKHWESEDREAAKRVVRAEAERDAASHEVAMARLETEVRATPGHKWNLS